MVSSWLYFRDTIKTIKYRQDEPNNGNAMTGASLRTAATHFNVSHI